MTFYLDKNDGRARVRWNLIFATFFVMTAAGVGIPAALSLIGSGRLPKFGTWIVQYFIVIISMDVWVWLGRWAFRAAVKRGLIVVIKPHRDLVAPSLPEGGLSLLESSFLSELGVRMPFEREEISSQVETATVVYRRNTGRGFVTRFGSVEPGRLLDIALNSITIYFRVDGLAHPVGMVLWTRAGAIFAIEGFTIAEESVHLDWTSVDGAQCGNEVVPINAGLEPIQDEVIEGPVRMIRDGDKVFSVNRPQHPPLD